MEIIPSNFMNLILASYLCESDNLLAQKVKDSDIPREFKREILKRRKKMRQAIKQLGKFGTSQQFKNLVTQAHLMIGTMSLFR